MEEEAELNGADAGLRLSVSQLAWGEPLTLSGMRTLAQWGIRGVELVPSLQWREWPPSQEALVEFRGWLNDAGLEISGVQSLFYGLDGRQLLAAGDQQLFTQRLLEVFDVGRSVGAVLFVLGAPRNRHRTLPGETLSVPVAIARATSLIGAWGDLASDRGLRLSVEPNASAYGAEYLTTYESTLSLLAEAGSDGLVAQVDTGNATLEGQDPIALIASHLPAHVHLSRPHLAGYTPEGQDRRVLDELTGRGYDGWVVYESRHLERSNLKQNLTCLVRLHDEILYDME